MGKWCLHASSFIFNRIVITVAGNQDRHKSLVRIRLLTLELLALEWRKFYTFKLEYLWGQLANLDQILCVASLGGGERLHNVLRQIGSKLWCPWQNEENGVSNFSRLLLIRSFLFLQVTRTCIKSRTSSNFGLIGPLTTELAALELLKHLHYTYIGENSVSMLACSFLIESSSKLLVTRTGIKAWLSSILGRIRPLILELLALEWWKFHTFELEYLRS